MGLIARNYPAAACLRLAPRTTTLPIKFRPSVLPHHPKEAGKQHVPFTTGLLIGDSAKLRKTASIPLSPFATCKPALRPHIQGSELCRNFRAKPTMSHGARARGPARARCVRAAAVDSLVNARTVNIQESASQLNAPYYEELLDAGIHDWGGNFATDP